LHVRLFFLEMFFFNSLITVVGLTCNTRAVSRMPLASWPYQRSAA
jgi:hypothetical protein